MDVQHLHKNTAVYPHQAERMHKPPDSLYCVGPLQELMAKPRVAIVGSRRMSTYGKQVTERLSRSLAEQGVVIVSGLALGVDAQAHRTALAVRGLTMAVLPTPIDSIAPTSNQGLAASIVRQGGALVSQYPSGSPNFKGNFVARNELVAALSDILIVTEAAKGSGALHTVQFALDMGIHVFAVPGNITSPLSQGTNTLLQTGHAQPLIQAADVFRALQLTLPALAPVPTSREPLQQRILTLLAEGLHDGEQLFKQSCLSVADFNRALTMLEISGKVVALGANQWGLP